MLFSRISRVQRTGINGCRWFLFHRPDHHHQFFRSENPLPPTESTQKVLGCRETFSWDLPALHGFSHNIHHQSSSIVEEQQDPFSLVADELSLVADRLRSMVVAEVPKLASAAEYLFKMGVEGKRFRPTVLLLMATALNMSVPEPYLSGPRDVLTKELRARQQSIAEITEMIHVSYDAYFKSLVQYFDDADI